MAQRDPKKFDPAKAAVLDQTEREQYLPTETLLAALALRGQETVLDYGAGTGRLAVAIGDRAARVLAVDESDEMLEHLRFRLQGRTTNVEPLLISANQVPLPDGSVDRILAVNVLHEVRGEMAVAEMRRLLASDGLLLAVDWARGRQRDFGPPDHILFDQAGAEAELREAGFSVEPAELGLPYHYSMVARRA